MSEINLASYWEGERGIREEVAGIRAIGALLHLATQEADYDPAVNRQELEDLGTLVSYLAERISEKLEACSSTTISEARKDKGEAA